MICKNSKPRTRKKRPMSVSPQKQMNEKREEISSIEAGSDGLVKRIRIPTMQNAAKRQPRRIVPVFLVFSKRSFMIGSSARIRKKRETRESAHRKCNRTKGFASPSKACLARRSDWSARGCSKPRNALAGMRFLLSFPVSQAGWGDKGLERFTEKRRTSAQGERPLPLKPYSFLDKKSPVFSREKEDALPSRESETKK